MDWKTYEKEIHAHFRIMFPKARITHNTILPGRYSKIDRQIDVLIEDYAAGEKITIIVDGKYYSKNIDVKEVESFIGMMQDVSADKGLLITQKGYSQAAINRAHYDPNRIELDILNFKELKKFQGFIGIAHSGKHGVVMPSPFGWVIDATKRKGMLASLFQRGQTLENAAKNKEWMYINIFSKTKEINDLTKFLKIHEQDTLRASPDAKFTYSNTIKREDADTSIRTIHIKHYPTLEYTGFVEFQDFIFFCVLFTPEELKEKNIKKLEYILAKVIPFNVNLESLAVVEMHKREALFSKSSSTEEKTLLAMSMAEIYIDINDVKNARKKYQLSIQLSPECYPARKALLELEIKHSGKIINETIVNKFYNLSKTNPTVNSDLADIFFKYNRAKELIAFWKKKALENNKNHEVLGNINFHIANAYLNLGVKEKAIAFFEKAKNNFKKCFDEKHEVFEEIENALIVIKGLK